MPAKVALAFLLALLLFPTLSLSSWILPDNIPGFIWLVTAEILVGIVMGLVFMIMVFALQLAGRMLGFQMAFSMATVVDTTFGENSSIISVFMVLVGTMMIIAVGGDHYLLYTLSHSFEVLVPGHFASTKPLLKEFSKYLMHSFEVGFKLSAPAIILLLCIDITLGLIGKTAQKMQIFFVGLPLKLPSACLALPLYWPLWPPCGQKTFPASRN